MGSRVQTLAALCHEYQLDIVYVFGSRAADVMGWFSDAAKTLTASPSDVDIGVKPTRGVHLNVTDKVRLAQALEDLLDVTRVDLVVIPDVDPFLAANIIRGERLYARDTYLADEYDLYILRRAGDLAPLERERQALILGKGWDK